MILEKIKYSPLRRAYLLSFSNQAVISISPDDAYSLKLTPGQEINQTLYQKINQLSLSFLVKSYALRQIAISPKSEKILRQKIHHRYPQVSSLLVEDTISYLRRKNLLDESAYIDYFLKRHPKKSARHLQFLFRQQGINYRPSSKREIPKIISLLQRRQDSLKLLSRPLTKNRLLASLIRKGFSLADVKTAIDEFIKSR